MRILHNIGLINVVVLAIIAVLTPHPWYFLILAAAQLIFVPIVLSSIIQTKRIIWFAFTAYLAVVFIHLTPDMMWHGILAAIYLLYTLAIALAGFKRFLNRGFTHLEEFLIDLGMIFLSVGGVWFFAYEAGIQTGFSPIITFLTAVHFHYAGFLLPILTGFLGRLGKSSLYMWTAPAVIVAPVLVALGITFSTTLEFVSVLVYIFAIYGLLLVSFKTNFQSSVQKWMFRMVYLSLGVSILFSLLYAYGNWSGNYTITIDFMIKFHGVTNAVLFAGAGTVLASMFIPDTQYRKPKFPISELRGGLRVGENFLSDKTAVDSRVNGLVDDMSIYHLNLAPTIRDFYENTSHYRLWANVHWSAWFKPLAALYKLMSRQIQQINLPLSSQKVEMTGEIVELKPNLDSRERVRAWFRKIKQEPTFIALYSEHETEEGAFMNIALPLPGSTMTGILNLKEDQGHLILSSEQVGIYLVFRDYVMKLPLDERFTVWETTPGELQAEHRMWILGMPFLQIRYEIKKK
ncbi:YndJ family protein [Aquisalibacillus elongatus]|uniref:YndJ family protein n=1 Tax=Aquisalibacillus elongatus TaxID=485577 RepID=UPI001475141F|nr:YndJ family protein [Aquisalibacillus elongatus]